MPDTSPQVTETIVKHFGPGLTIDDFTAISAQDVEHVEIESTDYIKFQEEEIKKIDENQKKCEGIFQSWMLKGKSFSEVDNKTMLDLLRYRREELHPDDIEMMMKLTNVKGK